MATLPSVQTIDFNHSLYLHHDGSRYLYKAHPLSHHQSLNAGPGLGLPGMVWLFQLQEEFEDLEIDRDGQVELTEVVYCILDLGPIDASQQYKPLLVPVMALIDSIVHWRFENHFPGYSKHWLACIQAKAAPKLHMSGAGYYQHLLARMLNKKVVFEYTAENNRKVCGLLDCVRPYQRYRDVFLCRVLGRHVYDFMVRLEQLANGTIEMYEHEEEEEEGEGEEAEKVAQEKGAQEKVVMQLCMAILCQVLLCTTLLYQCLFWVAQASITNHSRAEESRGATGTGHKRKAMQV